MKIAIAGVGLAGAYLYRLLSLKGVKVDLFGRPPGTRCGISPCAWGTSRGFSESVSLSGLDPESYVLQRPETILLNEVRVKANLMTFRKPDLIQDLLKGAEAHPDPIDPGMYDRIIDATGVARSYLPTISDDIVLRCIQFRIRTEDRHENRVKLGGIGYAWCFPLSANEYHIGCGSLLRDPQEILSELGWIDEVKSGGEIVCGCKGRIRLTSPRLSQPFVVQDGRHSTWGVGETIGCVAPLAGDGILSAMRSAQILTECLDDPVAYTEAILKEFDWMTDERGVLDKLRTHEALGLKDAWVLKRNSKRMGMEIRLRDSSLLLKTIR